MPSLAFISLIPTWCAMHPCIPAVNFTVLLGIVGAAFRTLSHYDLSSIRSACDRQKQALLLIYLTMVKHPAELEIQTHSVISPACLGPARNSRLSLRTIKAYLTLKCIVTNDFQNGVGLPPPLTHCCAHGLNMDLQAFFFKSSHGSSHFCCRCTYFTADEGHL